MKKFYLHSTLNKVTRYCRQITKVLEVILKSFLSDLFDIKISSVVDNVFEAFSNESFEVAWVKNQTSLEPMLKKVIFRLKSENMLRNECSLCKVFEATKFTAYKLSSSLPDLFVPF